MGDRIPTRYYFGYGSNMHRAQMKSRCPTSQYYDRAFLLDWKFVIVEEGYASINRCEDSDIESGNDRVWGSIYTLEPSDELALDGYEGVKSHVYTKEEMEFVICPPGTEKDETKWKKVMGLVYVATTTKIGYPRLEYIGRMNKAIADAELPEEYVEKVLRSFIPDQ